MEIQTESMIVLDGYSRTPCFLLVARAHTL